MTVLSFMLFDRLSIARLAASTTEFAEDVGRHRKPHPSNANRMQVPQECGFTVHEAIALFGRLYSVDSCHYETISILFVKSVHPQPVRSAFGTSRNTQRLRAHARQLSGTTSTYLVVHRHVATVPLRWFDKRSCRVPVESRALSIIPRLLHNHMA